MEFPKIWVVRNTCGSSPEENPRNRGRPQFSQCCKRSLTTHNRSCYRMWACFVPPDYMHMHGLMQIHALNELEAFNPHA